MIQTQQSLSHLPKRFPLLCQWEITCRCNLHCVMCYTDCFNRPDKIREELSSDEIFRIMDELAEAGCLELCLTGGEPFARSDFMHIYEHAISKGFLVTIFSNGTLITEDMVKRLAQAPPYRIEISMHGFTEQTFEDVTQGRGSYQRCLSTIRLLLDHHLPLVLKTTAMRVNKHEILSIKDYVGSLSVPYKLGEEIRPTLDGVGEPMQLALSHDELEMLNRQDPDLWEEACEQASTPKPICTSGLQRFHIDAYGRLQLCSGNRQQSYDLRHGSFAEGFYQYLPSFHCKWKAEQAGEFVQLGERHA